MSNVQTLEKPTLKNLALIKAMCVTHGWKFHENQTTYKWWGRHVGDYPMPKDMKMEDLGKCHHAISIPGCKYEIGIIQKNDHLVIAYDAFDRNLAEAIGAKAAKFNQYYEAEHVRAQFRANGYIFHESKTEDGTLTYHAAKTKEELLAFANGA